MNDEERTSWVEQVKHKIEKLELQMESLRERVNSLEEEQQQIDELLNRKIDHSDTYCDNSHNPVDG